MGFLLRCRSQRTAALAAATLAVAVLTALPAQAQVTVFTNRTSWEAAVGSFVTETFDSLADTNFVTGLNDAGLIDVLITGVADDNGIRGAASAFDINGTQFLRGETDLSGSDVGVPSLIFASPTSGFAADFTRTIDFARLTVTIGADTIEFDNFLSGDGTGFLGFVSADPFLRADFSQELTTTTNELFGLDNLSIAAAPQAGVISEPGTCALLAAGLLPLAATGASALRVRKRKA